MLWYIAIITLCSQRPLAVIMPRRTREAGVRALLRSLTKASCAVIGAAAALGLAAGAVPAQAATVHGWQITKVYGTGAQNYDPAWPGALAVPSRNAAWMIWGGCTWPCDSGVNITVVEHWNGHRWAAVPASELRGMTPGVVTASSSKDAWLFGPFPKGRYAGALHWNGTKWTKRSVPTWLIRINGSGTADIYPADFSPNNLWVFSLGGYIGEKTAFAAHYQNGRWTKSYLPDIPDSAAAISSKDIWVIGHAFNGKGPDVLMHWNGHRWSKSRFPKQPIAGYPVNLTAVGPHDLWAAWSPAKAGEAEYLLHWNGAHWSKVDFKSGDSGYLFSGDGHGGLWIYGNLPGPNGKERFFHLSAGGWTTWGIPLRKGESQGNVDEFALIPGTTSLWAVGNVFSPGGGNVQNRTVIWRYNQ